MKTASHYVRKLRENPDIKVGVDLATNAISANKKGFVTLKDRKQEEWRRIKSRIIAKYGLALTAVQVVNEIVLEMANL